MTKHQAGLASTHDTKNEQSVQRGSSSLSTPAASLGTLRNLRPTHKQSDKKTREETTIKRFKLQNAARQLLPGKRVANCLRTLIPGATTVEVYHVPERDGAHYHNLRTCDSVWDCPVCAAKITERRRVEMMLALARAYEDGLTPVLVTYTLRHHGGDRLADLLAALKGAYRKFKSGRTYQAFIGEFGIVGSVSSTEVTHGRKRAKNNGWHPHLHALVFVHPIAKSKLDRMEGAFRTRWTHVLEALGYDASWEHGLTVKEGDAEIARYVAKWGHEPKDGKWNVDRELTKGPAKMASDDGETPFQLLEAYADGDHEAGALFQEYSAVFHGRSQLVWSRGLRALLGMGEEKPDGEVVAAVEETAVLLATLTRYTWYRILFLPNDHRGELLALAAAGDGVKFIERVLELVGPDETAPPAKKKGKPPMFIPCPKCYEEAHFLRVGHTPEHGAHAEFWCRHCGDSVFVYDLTEAQAVEGALLEETLSDTPPPAREIFVEEQLRLPVDMPRVTD